MRPGMYRIMKSQNLTEFKAAVARQLMPRWNLLYSDAENIFWVHNGNVARRAEGYDWSKPVPGWTKETEWGPYLPFEVYPQAVESAVGLSAELQQSAVGSDQEFRPESAGSRAVLPG